MVRCRLRVLVCRLLVCCRRYCCWWWWYPLDCCRLVDYFVIGLLFRIVRRSELVFLLIWWLPFANMLLLFWLFLVSLFVFVFVVVVVVVGDVDVVDSVELLWKCHYQLEMRMIREE